MSSVSAGGQYLSLATLSAYVGKGFTVLGDRSRESFSLHPQDLEVIREVATTIAEGKNANVVAPFCSGLSLAFLVRALAVASANRKRVAVFSSDSSLPRFYKSLTYLGNGDTGSIASVYPLRRRGAEAARVAYCPTLNELRRMKGDRTLIFDGRDSWRIPSEGPPPWSGLEGPKVVVTRLDRQPVAKLLAESQTIYVRSTGRTLDRWPKVLGAELVRLNNYARGVSFSPQGIPGLEKSMARLEAAAQKLEVATRGVKEAGFQRATAARLSRMVQNSILPLRVYEGAAHGLGRYWIYSWMSWIKSAFQLEIPSSARTAFRVYLAAANDALRMLSLEHPPKVSWFEQFLLESKATEVNVYCSSEIEAEALASWNNSYRKTGVGQLIPVSRTRLLETAFTSRLFVPGPPTRRDLASLLSGAARDVRVLVYPWQAHEWNALTSSASRVLERAQPVEEVQLEDLDGEVESGIDWYTPELKESMEAEEALLNEFTQGAKERMVSVKTDIGTFSYGEGSLILTLYIDKFVERPVTLLRSGDTIVVRTGGNKIDTRETVDGLARTSPELSEAAIKAGVWRLLLAGYVKSKTDLSERPGNETVQTNTPPGPARMPSLTIVDASDVPKPKRRRQMQSPLRETYASLFPKEEVTYATIRGWFTGQRTIGPNNRNLAMLLERIGIPNEQGRKVMDDVHKYRSYRMKVYRHIYDLWILYSGRLYRKEDEDTPESDEKIDAELGLTLASLEGLISFATVKEVSKVGGVEAA
jgi:hypothetical protein